MWYRIDPASLTLIAMFTLALCPSSRAESAALPPLPEGLSSFGAAVTDHHLYVYGGHIGKAHDHSAANLSQRFMRLDLRQPERWEALPMQSPVQGLALVAHGGKVYRIGGLSARNDDLDREDLHSLADVACYDPDAGRWESLTPLPEPRSSHDAAVLGDKVYVFGGWSLAGDPEATKRWSTDGYVADLTERPLRWSRIPDVPFNRRAVGVAAAGDRVVVMGGITRPGKTSNAVHVFDSENETWTRGPDLPIDNRMRAFGVAAYGLGQDIYASGFDGRVYRLGPHEKAWVQTPVELASPRFFHRLIPNGSEALFAIAGASHDGHLADIETLRIDKPNRRVGADTWSGFRGSGDSHTRSVGLPTEWSEDQNIAWSVALTGYGQSSPVIHGGRVFVTSVDGPQKENLYAACYDLYTGDLLWKRHVEASQHIEDSDYVSKGAPTGAVDKHGFYTLFESGDLIVMDHQGKTLWSRSLTGEFGPIRGNHGLGASLAQTDEALVILVDHEGPSYLMSIDKTTGVTRWKNDREPRVSWSSPIIVPGKEGEGDRIIVSSNGIVEAYSAENGERYWYLSGLEGNTVPSVSTTDTFVIVGSSEKASSIAIRRGGSGDVTDSAVVWSSERASSTFSSPLVHRGRVYYVNRAGVAFCLDLQTGRERWAQRIDSSCWATPIAAGDRVYFFSKTGQTRVFDAGSDEPRVIGIGTLETDSRVYGVAAIDGAFIIRMGRRLVCVGKPSG